MKVAIIFFFLIELTIVSYLDLKYKKISNYWTILNLVLAVFFYASFRELYLLDWNIFLYPVSFLLVGFVLFAINLMGAGDAKFLFSFYLMLPFEIHDEYFTSLLVTTIVISIINLLTRAYNNRSIICNEYIIRNYKGITKILFGGKMPYAPVIMIAWMVFVWDYMYDVF